MTAPAQVPYLIVGAGPVGLTAAALLAQHGQRCLIVERRSGPQRHPAAHAVNPRTLEIFRQAGLDMDAIGSVATDPADGGHVNFLTRLDGELIGRLPYERQGPDCTDLTPTPLRNISQHRLEPILARAAADCAGVDLRYSTQWESSVQDPDGVTSVIEDLVTGDRVEVRSRYVLAADGAGSRVRKSLGIEMAGPPRLESFIAVHFAADLRSIVRDRPGVLHFTMDPAASGVFVAHDIDREWVFMVAFDPDRESVEDYDVDRCRALVRSAIGREDVPVEVVGTGSWHMSAQVADRMRDGRIFLVGDAAHRFPPTGGLGLNTGVGDVHGLVWKLCAVEDGWAAAGLLDTYESERQPVARLNCEQSTANAFTLISLFEALGLTEDPSTEALLARLRDDDAREAIADAVSEQATHFDMLGLQLGYVYGDGALVRDGDAPPPLEDPSRFEPDGVVGGRLPHGWIGAGRSTLDLVAPGSLTLLSMGDHEGWARACRSVDAPVVHVRAGIDAEISDAWRRRCAHLGPDGALLVRPDQHIAWRAEHAPVDEGAALGRAVGSILARR